MRHVTRICDRCRGCIVEQGSVIEIKAGSLTRQQPETLDLCEDCSRLLTDFIQSGHQAVHAGPVAAIPGTLEGFPSVAVRSV
jgi:hypothetical protein